MKTDDLGVTAVLDVVVQVAHRPLRAVGRSVRLVRLVVATGPQLLLTGAPVEDPQRSGPHATDVFPSRDDDRRLQAPKIEIQVQVGDDGCRVDADRTLGRVANRRAAPLALRHGHDPRQRRAADTRHIVLHRVRHSIRQALAVRVAIRVARTIVVVGAGPQIGDAGVEATREATRTREPVHADGLTAPEAAELVAGTAERPTDRLTRRTERVELGVRSGVGRVQNVGVCGVCGVIIHAVARAVRGVRVGRRHVHVATDPIRHVEERGVSLGVDGRAGVVTGAVRGGEEETEQENECAHDDLQGERALESNNVPSRIPRLVA